MLTHTAAVRVYMLTYTAPHARLTKESAYVTALSAAVLIADEYLAS
jgi:hypothetical protein